MSDELSGVVDLFRQMTLRQLEAWLEGIQRYNAAGRPYGGSPADMVRWLDNQPGGWPDPEESAE